MANHGFVTTKFTFKADEVHEILEKLNAETFKNTLTIIRDGDYWSIECKRKEGGSYGYRSCWLASKRKFEMKHCGGSTFMWWVDGLIIDAVARKYDGIISDEGVENRWKPKEHVPTLVEHYKLMSPKHATVLMINDKDFIPPEFIYECEEALSKIRPSEDPWANDVLKAT